MSFFGPFEEPFGGALNIRPADAEPPPPLPYGVPMRCESCDPMVPCRLPRRRWSAVFTANGRPYTFRDLGDPVTVGLWFVAARVAGDPEHTARLLGGYATPAALIEALAGTVIFAGEVR
jgi:hypothetical protein